MCGLTSWVMKKRVVRGWCGSGFFVGIAVVTGMWAACLSREVLSNGWSSGSASSIGHGYMPMNLCEASWRQLATAGNGGIRIVCIHLLRSLHQLTFLGLPTSNWHAPYGTWGRRDSILGQSHRVFPVRSCFFLPQVLAA